MCRDGGCPLTCRNKACGRGPQFRSTPFSSTPVPHLSLQHSPFPGRTSQEKEVIPPRCRNWTPRSERCSAPWKLSVRTGSVQGPRQLRERSHLLNEIFSALEKEWQSRRDRAWNTWLKQRSALDFWAFFNEILLHTLNVRLSKILRSCTSNQSHGKWQVHSSSGKKTRTGCEPLAKNVLYMGSHLVF